jgi:hypothetical protein
MTISKLSYSFRALYSHLWLSISSITFYEDIRTKYTGYGIKYVFVICAISSLIYSISLLEDIERLHEYFVNGSNKVVEHIFTQIPDIKYDGQTVTTDTTLPHFIYDLHMRKFAVIDLDGRLSRDERIKIPIVLTKKNIIISIVEMAAQKRDNITLDYATIFGAEPRVLTATSIKEYLAYLLNYSTRVFIYLLMPLLILARFVGLCLEKTLAVAVIYILSSALNRGSSVQTACRLVMFASGISILIQPIVNIVIPQFSYLAILAQIIPGVMLITSLVQSRELEKIR